jgi:hypothetical protein
VVNISGGRFIVEGSGGTMFGTSAGPNKINFSAGKGEFRQTGSGKITFLGSGDADRAHINFAKDSKGMLSLAGVTNRDTTMTWSRGAGSKWTTNWSPIRRTCFCSGRTANKACSD